MTSTKKKLSIVLGLGVLFGGSAMAESLKETELLTPIGDSYTIGQGVAEAERWPNLLVKTLNDRGTSIRLTANPARSGWTVRDALERELSIIDAEKPSVVTVLLGTNDQVQGASVAQFKERYLALLDEIQARLARVGRNPKRVLLVGVPDYSITPNGKFYDEDKTARQLLRQFNEVIRQAATERGLASVDIFELSQEVENDPGLVADDGLHPSAKGYQRWLSKIEPAFTKLLSEQPSLPASEPRAAVRETKEALGAPAAGKARRRKESPLR